MKIGIPREIKNNENRVALTPAGVMTLTQAGHELFVEKNAGEESGFKDEQYQQAGATIAENPDDAWKQEMIMKVKEPLPEEYHYFYEGMILFTYLHLAAESELTQALIDKKVTAVAYETVQLENGTLPLLTPMSEVAGRMATQIGASFLEKYRGGRGILLSGIPGVRRGKVTIIGGGVVGTNAAKIALGMGAKVTIIDLNPERLRQLDDIFGSDIQTLMSNALNLTEVLKESDLAIGAVLIPGAKAPKLITEEMVSNMPEGAVIVDVAIDQGGIFETSDKITTHDNPTYSRSGVLHYAVANMPGAVPRTSTIGLTNVTVPYAMMLADKGLKKACQENESLRKGINTLKGYVTYRAVAEAHQLEYEDTEVLLQD